MKDYLVFLINSNNLDDDNEIKYVEWSRGLTSVHVIQAQQCEFVFGEEKWKNVEVCLYAFIWLSMLISFVGLPHPLYCSTTFLV